MPPQRRARAISMTSAELDAFLTEQRTCRVATVGASGPHVTPLWFAWFDGAIWLTSLSRSQRWTDLQRDPRVAVVIDAGEAYWELRGVELRGRVEVVGEVPRTGESNPELEAVEQYFADRYTRGIVERDGRHTWLRLTPDNPAGHMRQVPDQWIAPADQRLPNPRAQGDGVPKLPMITPLP